MTSAGDAWYAADRATFLLAAKEQVADALSGSAVRGGWLVEEEQHAEWRVSVDQLQSSLRRRDAGEIQALRRALAADELAEYSTVILEYNMRRRGLRLDCILLAPGAIVVVEFKRSRLGAADREQVLQYCANLVEFHEETRASCERDGMVVIPILALTSEGGGPTRHPTGEWYEGPWRAIARQPIECDASGLQAALAAALTLRRSRAIAVPERWLASQFAPSSTIVDAAIAMYGRHDVSAIRAHALPAQQIAACTAEVAGEIRDARQVRRNRVILVSGAPGAGKTLVGLDLTFDPEFRGRAVYVTGNAPLVDVLRASLRASYKRGRGRTPVGLQPGYALRLARDVVEDAALYAIAKAHEFLGERGAHTGSADGGIVVFDEAQRTYEEGREVLGRKLADHEADLVLTSLETSYPPGAVVVALLGHNQAINRGERGAIAWLEAADRHGWEFAVADETLSLAELSEDRRWSGHPLRRRLELGHLAHSMRFYRSLALEQWVDAVLGDDCPRAVRLAAELRVEGHTVWLSRDLEAAKSWVRARRVGEERVGLIASGQARRLAAVGLHVDLKPSIANWMLSPTGDPRSSNMLETVQNQYQIQGLELDYAVVCWDADLRRGEPGWEAFKMRGAVWQRDGATSVARNGYRVLLTRARKGMVIFVPQGDRSGEDLLTRAPAWYDGIADYLKACGAQPLVSATPSTEPPSR